MLPNSMQMPPRNVKFLLPETFAGSVSVNDV